MKAHRAEFPLAAMCRVLGLSPSGYYDWLKRPPSRRARRDEDLEERIGAIRTESGETYGRPRIHAALKAEGERVGQKRVGRLMGGLGLQGVTRRRWRTATTRRDAEARPAPDLVRRDFSASGPDELWVADITYVPTWAGWLYLAVVLDVWSRRVVGWAMATHMRTELVEAALAMGSVGDAYDNAMCESFFATLECELLDRSRFSDGRRGAPGDLPVHRGLLQHAPDPLGPRLRVAGQLREEQPCGLTRTGCAGPTTCLVPRVGAHAHRLSPAA